MNTTRFVSRFFAGLLAVATLALGGCASRPTVHVPYDRPYQYIQYWHMEAGNYGHRSSVGGGCTTTRYDSAIRFIVAVPCAPSANGSIIPGAGLERSRYSLNQLKLKLTEIELINNRHCAYAASPDQRWPSWECQKVVNEVAFLEREITKERRFADPQCWWEEKHGKQTRVCTEHTTGSWRK